MMAAGVGLHRIARPVFMLAVLFSIVSLVTYGWIQPLTRYAYRSVLFDVKNVDAFYLAEEGVFMQSGSRTFILDKLNRDTNTFEHVFLFDYRGPNGAETMTAANGLPVAAQMPIRIGLYSGQKAAAFLHGLQPLPANEALAA